MQGKPLLSSLVFQALATVLRGFTPALHACALLLDLLGGGGLGHLGGADPTCGHKWGKELLEGEQGSRYGGTAKGKRPEA
jgi:hypothetical protein